MPGFGASGLGFLGLRASLLLGRGPSLGFGFGCFGVCAFSRVEAQSFLASEVNWSVLKS